MTPHRTAKVYKVVLVPPKELSFFPRLDEYINAKLSPGNSTERYGREWIVGKTERTENILTGRIGYLGAKGVAEVWDEEAQDFHEVAVPAGLTSPFAVDLTTLQMALQPRGSIKFNGLIGAFRNLLKTENIQWQILTPEKEMTFENWKETVDRVTYVKFRLRKPNPHYQGTPDLEAVMEQAEAEVAALELGSEKGIDPESPFIKQSQQHVDSGYGEVRYKGQRELGTTNQRESVYNSDLGSEEEVFDIDVDDQGEVAKTDLAQVLAQGGQELQASSYDR